MPLGNLPPAATLASTAAVSTAAAAPKIFILDPSLTDVRGHHFQSLEDLVSAISPIEPVIIVNRQMDRGLVASNLDVHCLFTRTVYEENGVGPRPDSRLKRRWWKVRRAARQAGGFGRRLLVEAAHALPAPVRALAARSTHLSGAEPPQWPDLAKILEQTAIGAADHVVLPTAEPYLVMELADALARCEPSSRPHLHARFINAQPGAGRKDVDRMLARLAADPELAGWVHIYTETPAMGRFLADTYGAKTDLFPYLVAAPVEGPAVPQRDLSKPILFSYLGTARNEKGFGRLPSILRALVANPLFDPRKIAVLVQVGGTDARAAMLIKKFRNEISTLGLDVEFHQGGASPSQYAALLNRSDCLLLPYASDRYRLSGSGILFEAVLHAKPFICSAGLSFSDYARDGNAIEAECDERFAAAMLEIAGDPRPFFDAARRSAQVYRASLSRNALIRRLRSKANVDKDDGREEDQAERNETSCEVDRQAGSGHQRMD